MGSIGTIRAAFALAFATFTTSAAFACDPNEECNRCLASAFGHCISAATAHMRKKKGLPGRASCREYTWIALRPREGRYSRAVLRGYPPPQIQQCIANLSACPGQIIARIGYQTIRPIIDHYIEFLQNQAGNNLYRLDQSMISQIQGFYSIDLHQIRYAMGINTIHGQNITIGNTVYFVRSMDFRPERRVDLVSRA